MSSVSVEDCARVIIDAFVIFDSVSGSRSKTREWIHQEVAGQKIDSDLYRVQPKVMATRDFQVAKLLVRLLRRAGLDVQSTLDPKGLSRISTFTPRSRTPKRAPEGTLFASDYMLWVDTLSDLVVGSVWASDLGGELLSLSAAFSRLESSDLYNKDAIARKIRSLANELKAMN